MLSNSSRQKQHTESANVRFIETSYIFIKKLNHGEQHWAVHTSGPRSETSTKSKVHRLCGIPIKELRRNRKPHIDTYGRQMQLGGERRTTWDAVLRVSAVPWRVSNHIRICIPDQ